MSQSITIDAPQLENLLKKFPEKTKGTIIKSLKRASLLVQNGAKQLSPFKTGNLRRSITHKVDISGLVAEVGSDVIYARVREFNTKRLPGGYLRPSLKNNSNKIKGIFEDEINSLIKSL